MADREFTAVVRLIEESRLWRVVQWARRTWSAASGSSVVVRAAGEGWKSVMSWPVERRVQLVAWTVAWAAIGHLASRFVVPVYVAPALPAAGAISLLIAAVLVATMPSAFVRAWYARVGRGQNNDP